MNPQRAAGKQPAPETSELAARRGYEPFEVPHMHNVHATYLFEVAGGPAWRLRVDDGVARLLPGTGDADCVIEADDHDMALVMTGRQNLITAAMQGRLTVHGDMALAQRFHGAVSAAKQRRS